jgi:integrating conjugative element membrane protein (TIGR03747 family)
MTRRAPNRYELDPAERRQGLLARTAARITRALRWLALSLLISIAIECLGIALWWPEAGPEHSRTMLQTELDYLQRDFSKSLITDSPGRFAASFAEHARSVFELTGFRRLSSGTSNRAAQEPSALRSLLRYLSQVIAPYAEAARNIVQLFAVRLAVLILTLPTFVLFSVVGLIDGLVRRDLRRWGGGRESSYLYHYAKKSVWRFVLIAAVSYLALPVSLHPAFILLPFATLFAVSISITASTFKKYL